MFTEIKLLTIREASKLIDGFSEYNIRKLIKSGKLEHLKSGNRVLIDEQTIYAFISNAKEVAINE
ncbi:MAG: helix-turn-helix domain-containing protein [Clostridia bacterium]